MTDNIPTLAEIQESRDNMLSITEFMESSNEMLTDQYGDTRKTLTGIEKAVNVAVSSAGYQIVGDFADVTKVQITAENQVYTSKSVTDSEDVLWRCTQTLPYTPTGSDPSDSGDDEYGKWVVVAQGELKAIARSLNVSDGEVIYATDTTTVLDDVLYIYDSSTQVTYGVPTLSTTGEKITSVSGDQLTTSTAEVYTLTQYDGGAVTATNSSYARTLGDRFGAVAELEDFQDLVDGDDWTDALNAALATGKNVRVPNNNGRTFGIRVNLTFSTPGQMLFGDGRDVTTLTAISSTHPTSIVDVSDSVDNVFVTGITFNGDKDNRPDVTDGQGVYIRSSQNTIEHCRMKNWPNSGILINGGTYTADDNMVFNNIIIDNDGVGLSQSSARFTKVMNNTFARNGLENLTIDTTSYGCRVIGNYFKKHYGGCGCVGWDESDNVTFMGNILDGENEETASTGNQVGICWNANTGENKRGKIIGNTIINYPEYGIRLRDRTADGGYLPGTGVITGNSFSGNGTADISCPDLDGELFIGNNGDVTYELSTNDSYLRLASGDVKFDAESSADKIITGDGAWAIVPIDTLLQNRNVTLNTNTVSLPIGGTYTFYGKVRFESIPTDATALSLALYVNGSETELFNETLDGSQTVAEITISPNVIVGQGDMALYVRMFTTSGTTTATLVSGSNSSFQGTYIG